ncbi:MAG: tripartite tricarboxylate transporter TctB family protein [Rhodospirillales bacterium]|jgi:hypothetical protein|nr:tripartite tricarboxylate transporter TctB family protein [Rhodospirillales bacterium]
MFIKELFIPAVVVVYGISYYLATNHLAEESIVFPYFLLALMPVFIVLIVIGEYRKEKDAKAAQGDGPIAVAGSLADAVLVYRNPAILIGTAAVYLLLFVLTNFLVSTTIYLFLTMAILRVPWIKSAIIAAGFTFALYYIFAHLFAVPL